MTLPSLCTSMLAWYVVLSLKYRMHVPQIQNAWTHYVLVVFCSQANIAGRGTESAIVKKDQIELETIKQNHLKYKILRHRCNLYKTQTSQDLRLFPHKTSPFLDYYFTMAYNFIVRDMPASDYVMKKFSTKALAENKSNKPKSEVSNLWFTLFTSCIEFVTLAEVTFAGFVDTPTKYVINPQLRSHCGKKRSVHEMAAAGLYVLSIVFRAGWETRYVRCPLRRSRNQNLSLVHGWRHGWHPRYASRSCPYNTSFVPTTHLTPFAKKYAYTVWLFHRV